MSVFVCGETASGKTTLLNAIFPFIPYDQKIFSAEDTLEVQPPHSVWQQLSTREFGPEDSKVDTFALLRSGLRSRPNYIIVGEIRGKEGNVAFQAMQTGIPVMATFHAASIKRMIQRFPRSLDQEDDTEVHGCSYQRAGEQHGQSQRRGIPGGGV